MNPFERIANLKVPFTGKAAATPTKPETSPQVWYLDGKAYTSEAAASAAADEARAVVENRPVASHSILPTANPTVTATVAPEPIVPEQTASKPAVQETSVSTAPVTTAPKPNGFISFLKGLGKDIAKIVTLGAAFQNTAAVQSLESLVIPSALVAVITKWANTALTVESTAAAAATQASSATTLTGTQKAALVISSLEGDIQTVAQQLGASPLTQADLQTINTAIVTILNTLQVPATS